MSLLQNSAVERFFPWNGLFSTAGPGNGAVLLVFWGYHTHNMQGDSPMSVGEFASDAWHRIQGQLFPSPAPLRSATPGPSRSEGLARAEERARRCAFRALRPPDSARERLGPFESERSTARQAAQGMPAGRAGEGPRRVGDDPDAGGSLREAAPAGTPRPASGRPAPSPDARPCGPGRP